MATKKATRKRKPGRPEGTTKDETERLPWRFPVKWGLRSKIEDLAKSQGKKPIEILAARFGIQQESIVEDNHG